jgi:hypothetical protein
MGIRLVLGAILVCALLGAEGSTLAGAAQKRVLKGRTAQGKRVRLAVDGGHVDMLHFKARLRCRNGTVLIVDESGFLPTPLRGAGFSDRQVGSTDQVFFRGRVRGRAVQGRLRVTDRLSRHGARCASRWIGFSAHA